MSGEKDRQEQSDDGLEARVAKVIADACDDAIATSILDDDGCAHRVIALVREQVATEIEAFRGEPPFSPLEQAAMVIAAMIARGASS